MRPEIPFISQFGTYCLNWSQFELKFNSKHPWFTFSAASLTLLLVHLTPFCTWHKSRSALRNITIDSQESERRRTRGSASACSTFLSPTDTFKLNRLHQSKSYFCCSKMLPLFSSLTTSKQSSSLALFTKLCRLGFLSASFKWIVSLSISALRASVIEIFPSSANGWTAPRHQFRVENM